MSLIRDNNVLWYHPLDSDTEHTQSFDWTRSANAAFQDGLIVSGLYSTTTANASITGSVAGGGYTNLNGTDHFAVAFWSSGLYGGTLRTDTIEIGFGASDVSDGNGVQVYSSNAAQLVYVRLHKGGTSGPFREITTIPTHGGWHLTIIDFSLQGSTWRYLVSINGSGWQNIGSGHNSNLPDSDANCRIELDLEYTSENIVLDEIVIWKDHDQFSAEELSNIYELVNTHNQPMSQYSNTFGAPSASGVDFFINGAIQTSGDISLYIPGQKESASTNLFEEGHALASGNLDFYVHGIPLTATGSITLYMPVPAPSSGEIDCFSHGHQVSSGDVNQYIHGYIETSGNVDLYISGVPAISSSVDLYTVGPLVSSGNMSEFVWGHQVSADSGLLFIKGLFPTIDAFVSTTQNNPSSNINLWMYGVESGAPTTSHTNDSLTLFIKDIGDNQTVDSTWSSFARVDSASTIEFSGSWDSFVRCGNTLSDDIGLYSYGHASGELPHGILLTDSSALIVVGLGDSLSDGYSISRLNTPAFAKVYSGVNNTLTLYTSGSVETIPPSATLDLFIFGIIDTETNECNSYIYGRNTNNDSINLSIFGIQGVGSGSAQMYIEVTNIGLSSQSSSLYSHGF